MLPEHTHTHTKLPILQRLLAAYKIWQEDVRHFPKDLRYTLGSKIDKLFLQLLEHIFITSTLIRQEKIPVLKQASISLDLLKFFLQVAWECKALDNKKYIRLSELLAEIGKMLGGWIKQSSSKENPAPGGVMKWVARGRANASCHHSRCHSS